jgi:nucleotide-binding universal stress UspA family protein
MMGYKDVLVAVDSAPSARARIGLAAGLAERFGAHLIGLHHSISFEAPHVRGYFEYFNRSLDALYQEFAEQMRTDEATVRGVFEEIASHHSLSAEWRQSIGYPSHAAALHGRYVDLIVLGQPDPDYVHAALFQPSPAEVALAVGRPMLVVPYAGKWTDIGRSVVIGWDASRQATRAVNDALPFLTAAQTVTVLTVDPRDGPLGHGDVPGADIALHLARHAVKATAQSTVSAGIDVGNELLCRVSDLGADLLVMGAYGHSRERELVFGGATRTVLATMTVPVLMAH